MYRLAAGDDDGNSSDAASNSAAVPLDEDVPTKADRYVLNIYSLRFGLQSISTASPTGDGNASDSSAAEEGVAKEEDPGMAVTSKEFQDPKLYSIYKNLPVLTWVSIPLDSFSL